jgi:peptidoglycan-associated lipoprotein
MNGFKAHRRNGFSSLEIGLLLLLLVALVLVPAGCKKKKPSEETTPAASEEGMPLAGERESLDSGDISGIGREGAGSELLGRDEQGLQDIYFAFDRYDLSLDAQNRLQTNAEWLQANPGVSVVIEGHCDERGSNEYNLALGERRAAATKEFLVSLGVSAQRLRTISYGEEMPLDPGHSEEAWSKNRRGHFLVVQ